MKPREWKKITIETYVPQEAISFHVDTRFFYWTYNDEPLTPCEDKKEYHSMKFNKVLDLIKNGDVDEKYLINAEEIMPFVFSMREIRDLNKAIILNFNVDKCEWWVKYLRFYSYKGRFLVTNDCEPIEWRKLTNVTFSG